MYHYYSVCMLKILAESIWPDSRANYFDKRELTCCQNIFNIIPKVFRTQIVVHRKMESSQTWCFGCVLLKILGRNFDLYFRPKRWKIDIIVVEPVFEDFRKKIFFWILQLLSRFFPIITSWNYIYIHNKKIFHLSWPLFEISLFMNQEMIDFEPNR